MEHKASHSSSSLFKGIQMQKMKGETSQNQELIQLNINHNKHIPPQRVKNYGNKTVEDKN